MKWPGLIQYGMIISLLVINGSCGSSRNSFSGASRQTVGSPPAASAQLQGTQPVSYQLSTPAATNQYVFIANTTNNTVAEINKVTFSIKSISVGSMPTTVDVTPDNKTAVVFNSGDYSVSLIDISSDTVTTLPVDTYDNTMVLSPTGSIAITYFDPSKSTNLTANPTRTFNQITILNIAAMTSQVINVNYLPQRIIFTGDGTKAVVVTTSQIGVVSLTAGYPVTRYQLVDPSQQQIDPESLKLTADGNYALAVIQNSNDVVVQNITTGAQSILALGPTVTDIELTADNARAIAVNSGNGSLSFITLSTFSTSTIFTGLDINRIAIAQNGTNALLYTTNPTTTVHAGESVHVLTLTDDTIQAYPVIKGVSSVIMLPFTSTVGVSSAIIVHAGPGGSSSDPVKQFFYNHYAVTLFNMTTGVSTPIALLSAPTLFAFSDDGVYAYAMMPDSDAIAVFNLLTQISTGVYVPSAPYFVGVMPALHTAYIGESYPLGRLSFIEPDQGMLLMTITGFELGTY